MSKTGGRQIQVGIGMESTPGTTVAMTDFFKWDSFSFQANVDKTMLTSARGIRTEVSNSIINRRYGKGALEVVPTVDIMPYIFGLALGVRTTTTDADASGIVYDHTYTVQNLNASMKTATIGVQQGGIQTETYGNCIVDSMDLTFAKDLGKCKLALLGQYPTTGATLTPSYTYDTLFSRNNLRAQFGSSLSNAAGSAASTVLTNSGTTPVTGSSFVIGTQTYTWVNALSGAAYEVLIGVSVATSLVNAQSAINGTAGAGTTYGVGTLQNTQFVAPTVTVTTLTLTAIMSGVAANTIATTASSSPASHCTWSGSTVNSGTPGTGPDPLPLVDFSLSHNNAPLMDDAFLSGSTDVAAGGFVAGPLTLKGAYTLQYADTVGLNKYKNNTNDALIVTLLGARIGTSASESIILKLGRLILTKTPLEYQIKGLTYLKQEFEVQYDATDHEFTAVVVNLNAGTNY